MATAPPEIAAARKRPVAVTLLCVVMFVTVSTAGVASIMRDASPRSPLMAIHIVSFYAVIMSIIGIILMRKWGILLYAFAVTANISLAFAGGRTLTWPNYVVPLVIVAIASIYYRQMTWR